MAHFAELSPDNVVLRVLVVANQDILDASGNEQETLGVAFLQKLFGANTRWVQTSYSGSFRGCYAGQGMKYDPISDIFFASAVPVLPLDESNSPLQNENQNPEAQQLIRARDDQGRFIADDPATPENEAWMASPVP